MKVLYINTVFDKGSTGRIVKDLGTAVEENGGEYRVIYGRGSSKDLHAIKMTNYVEVVFHALLSRITDRAGFYSKGSTRRMVRYIREYNPDIIHLHNLHGYYVNVEILFNYLKTEYKGKVIWTLHDCWAFTGHCVHYTWAKCDKWKLGCSHCVEKRRYPKSVLCDNSYKNYLKKKGLFVGLPNLTIVTPSEWLANQVKQSFLKNYSVYVINNGIDLGVFRLYKYNSKKLNSEKKIVLNIMDGFDERKGYWDLVELSKVMPEEYQILIVGLKQKDCRKTSKKVTTISRTKNVEELVRLYNEAECFVNPTYEDTFPTVNIEALACGTPVITYRSCGSLESLSNECGIGVEPGNVVELKNAILSCNMNSEHCREQAELYDKREKYKEYIYIYRSVSL